MCLFACWFWFPFAVWDYTFITVLYRAWKGVCFDSQNEESIISKSWFPHVDNWARGKKSFKASPSNSFFFLWPELLFSVSETHHLSPLLVPLLLACGITRCGEVAALDLSAWLVFLFPHEGTFWNYTLASKAHTPEQSCWIPWCSCGDGLCGALSKEAPGPIPKIKSGLL